MKYRALLIKRTIEDVLMYPFILVGRLIGMFSPQKNYRIYFFFPFYHTGGAERIHAEIAKACGGPDCIIYFTRRSKDERFLDDFRSSGCRIVDVSKYTDNKLLYFLNLIYRGIISCQINRQSQNCRAFNGQCNFSYKISPWVRRDIEQIELIHSFNTFSFIRIPFLPFIHKTIMISKTRIMDHVNFYGERSIPLIYIERIEHIPNAVPIVPLTAEKENIILFVGRDSPEKRTYLFEKIAENLKDINAQFVLVGKTGSVSGVNYKGYLGEEELLKLYSKSRLLIITSSTEGFPLTLMEAMSQGVGVIATPVGDIPLHIQDGQNGWLFSGTEEGSILKEATQLVKNFISDQALQNRMEKNCRNYAEKHFSLERFRSQYRNLLHAS